MARSGAIEEFRVGQGIEYVKPVDTANFIESSEVVAFKKKDSAN